MRLKDDNKNIDIYDKAYELFDENVVKEIKGTFVDIMGI